MKMISTFTIILFITAASLTAAFAVGCKKSSVTAEGPKYSSEQVERGMVLVEEWKCNYCHSPEIRGNGRPVPDPERLLSGHPSDEEIPEMQDMIMGSAEYMEFLDNLDSTVWASNDTLVFSANLTPDNDTGIGAWNEEMFVETMRSGRHQGLGRRILYPMPWEELGELDAADLVAIYAYLVTIKPVSNRVPPPIVLFR